MNGRRLTFLLAKDPAFERSGDVAMMELLLDLAERGHEVSVICLSDRPDAAPRPGWMLLPKPPVRRPALVWRAVSRRRSLVHTRFCTPDLIEAIDACEADAFIAVHSYMAEAFLRSRHAGRVPLFVSHVVPEAAVWRSAYGLVGRQQARAITRDEARVARAATAVGSYDAADAEQAARDGARRSVWLEVTLPPRERIDVAATGPRLLLLGDRTWAPNQQAYAELVAVWPRIAEGIAGAELVVVGRPGEPVGPLPDGVSDLGFVDDLDAVVGSCRALAAPVLVGGGVRVKLLEAAARGLPVVATAAAAGSLTRIWGQKTVELTDEFVDECRRLLLDPAAAAAEGARLHEANARHWASGRPLTSFDEWVRP